MKGKKLVGAKKRPAVKSEERDEGMDRRTYKVRCSLENAFYMFVEAHSSDEAELVAETHCEKHDREDDCFWESEASYKHVTFEAEEA